MNLFKFFKRSKNESKDIRSVVLSFQNDIYEIYGVDGLREIKFESEVYHAILNDLNFFNPYNKLSPMGNLSIDNIRIRETTY